MTDTVNHPSHYNAHPSGIECIDVVEHMGFNLGNAVKYLWRADEKGAPLEDLRKAIWYIQREMWKREREAVGAGSLDTTHYMTAAPGWHNAAEGAHRDCPKCQAEMQPPAVPDPKKGRA